MEQPKAAATAAEKARLKTVTGFVVSNKMKKSITVQVERLVRHPKFGKFQRKYTTYTSHDEKNEARPGDKVTIISCRPLSKSKRWTLKAIVERARGSEVTAAPAVTPTT